MENAKARFLTYSWLDNPDDVDYLAQELRDAGIQVPVDRFDLVPGQRLWDSIAGWIDKSDAWGIFLTRNSLSSEPCMEELSYALDRALAKPGYSLIGQWHEIDASQVPKALKVRLGVRLSDPDRVQRVLGAVLGEPPRVDRPRLDPVEVTVHEDGAGGVIVELRPRLDVIAPFRVAVPLSFWDPGVRVRSGPARTPHAVTWGEQGVLEGEAEIGGEPCWFHQSNGPAAPYASFYLFARTIPGTVFCGHPEKMWSLKLK
ncbi:MAG: toll/interleukin-1 receptor domain-containing protein [Fimbriimonadaceae bacterium]|nr:toll/interleukin-1 receptor domain-containing protein [Fimbriimonadaceae bacterium]